MTSTGRTSQGWRSAASVTEEITGTARPTRYRLLVALVTLAACAATPRALAAASPPVASIEQGALSLRAQVVLDALDTAARLSPDDVRRLKFSSRMRAADLLLPELLDAAASVGSPSERLRSGIETLASWDRQAAGPGPRCVSN